MGSGASFAGTSEGDFLELDPANPVVALCAAGMAIEGDSAAASELFERAWAERRDDYDACIAAHFLARHQSAPEATLHWNSTAVRHALAVGDGRAAGFLASLYLNLGDSLIRLERREDAVEAAKCAREHLESVPAGGYRDFVEYGVARLEQRVFVARGEQVD
jgi:hypothetical protein